MAEAFLRLSGQDRLDALGVAADRLGRQASANLRVTLGEDEKFI